MSAFFLRVSHPAQLSTKRELFFRDGPVPPAAPSAGGLLGLSKDSAGSLSSSGGGGGSAPPSYTSATGNRELAEGYVGFANLPNQVYRKAVKKGFEFTLMVVGECACRLFSARPVALLCLSALLYRPDTRNVQLCRLFYTRVYALFGLCFY